MKARQSASRNQQQFRCSRVVLLLFLPSIAGRRPGALVRTDNSGKQNKRDKLLPAPFPTCPRRLFPPAPPAASTSRWSLSPSCVLGVGCLEGFQSLPCPFVSRPVPPRAKRSRLVTFRLAQVSSAPKPLFLSVRLLSLHPSVSTHRHGHTCYDSSM